MIVGITHKICTKCNINKPVSDFYKRNGWDDRITSECKKCHYKQNKINRLSKSDTLEEYIRFNLYSIKGRAKKKNLDFNITVDDLILLYAKQQGKCALSGRKLTYGLNHTSKETQLSVDRIDSSKGYTPDNIQLVCDIVNTMKMDSSVLEFISWCNDIVMYNTMYIKAYKV